MLKTTHDIRKVALWLGHSSVQTTEVYYAHRNVM
jgi:integrase